MFNPIKNKLSALPIFKSDFNKNVGKVMTGTLISQLIVLAVTPILTRIYTPEDFSNLALYLSMVLILAVFATGKYDKAIILPKGDREAHALMIIAGIVSIIMGTLFLLLYFLFKNQIIKLFNVEDISDWLIFIPITIYATAFYNILNTWFNRKKYYLKLSGNKVIYAGTNGILKIFFQKLMQLGAFGLVLSEAISQFFATIIFGRIFYRENKSSLFTMKKKELITVLKKYKSFPLFSVPADFVNVLAKELPVLMLTRFYGPGIVGFYMLNRRMLDAPLFLISNSILEVFRQKATEEYHNLGNCRGIFISTLKKLFVISFFPFALLFFTAPILFSFIFGREWIVAGEYVQIFAIMYFFRFISSPLTYVMYITNKLNLNLILQLLQLIVVWMALYLGGNYFSDAKYTLIFLSIGYTIIYIVYLFVSYRLAAKMESINY